MLLSIFLLFKGFQVVLFSFILNFLLGILKGFIDILVLRSMFVLPIDPFSAVIIVQDFIIRTPPTFLLLES